MIQFSDSELNVIALVLQKADPMQMMGETQSALAKIRAYAQERTQAQADEAVEAVTDS